MNSFGKRLIITTFGESHGPALGGVIDGFPANFAIDFASIDYALSLRSPSTCDAATTRTEFDKIEWLSGIEKGVTLGSPIGFIIRNENINKADYEQINKTFRPSHCDYPYFVKYGITPQSGGGRASARNSAPLVVAGALAEQFLAQKGIKIYAYTSQIGGIKINKSYQELDLEHIADNRLRCPDDESFEKISALIKETALQKDTLGGVVSCVVKGVPAGIGEPIEDKLQAALAKAMLSIPAAKGFEYGEGFGAAAMRGSEHNDPMALNAQGKPTFKSNHAGGILAGITTGEDIYFNVGFKPASSIGIEQETLSVDYEPVKVVVNGRHDVCVVPRATAIVKAYTALIIMDYII